MSAAISRTTTRVGSPPASPSQLIGLLVAALIALGTLPLAVFGLAQLARTAIDQLSGPADVTDFVAIYSGPRQLLSAADRLYAPGATAAVDRSLTGLDRFDRPFSFLPHAAVLLGPLGGLPYGVAYFVWLIIGVAVLAVSVLLLAPRKRLWPILLPLLLPVQLALIMGQTSPLALLAFCALVRLIERRPALAGLVVGISPATWKPQLFAPALAVALAAARSWRALVALVCGPALVIAAYTASVGLAWIGDYASLGASMWSLVGDRTQLENAGQTLLGLTQWLLGPGAAATVIGIAASAAADLALAVLWWCGLRGDVRKDLQLAAVPVVAVIAAPHALGYDLTLWLASAWLLLRYVNERPEVKPLVWALLLSGWACANVVIVTENNLGFPWAAVHGLVTLASVLWLYATHRRPAEENQG